MNETLITDAIHRQWPDRVDALRELLSERITHMQRLLDERQTGINMALDLNTKETQRRLDLLNGEAEHLRAMQATYVPREVYAQNHNELTRAVQELGRVAANQQGRGQVMAAVVSVVVSIVVGLVFIIFTRLIH